jgi:hypothetical protein
MRHFSVVRNTYLYVNTGNFIDGSNNTANPYLQLLSVTNDTVKAHEEFVQVRHGNKTVANAEQALGISSGKPVATSPAKNKPLSKVAKIVIGVIIAGLVMLAAFGVLIWRCCCRNRRKRSGNINPYPDSRYQSLHTPAPDAATDMHDTAYIPPNNAPLATSYNPQQYTPYGSAQPFNGGYPTSHSKVY